MKHLIFAALIAFLFAAPANAAKLQLETPDQAKPGTMSYELDRFEIGLADDYVSITLVGENGETRTFVFTKDEAAAIIGEINSSKVQIKNLPRFLLRQLTASGRLSGTVAD